MKRLVVVLTVKDEAHIDSVLDHLKKLAEKTRAEPGCQAFEVLQRADEPQTFVLNETWESAEAHAVHREAAACKEIYEPLVLPLVDRVAWPLNQVE